MEVSSYRLVLVSIALITCWTEVNSGNIKEYLQPDDAGEYYEFASTDSNSCTRECLSNAAPKICYYKFILEDYTTLSQACGNCPHNVSDCYNPQCITADGVDRGLLSVNRRVPGPSIQVCQGDRIIVDVINHMAARSTTIHWHGIFQKGTPYMDGVPMITQCPILEQNKFRYDFYANQYGTFFWHSHEGIQKVDGLQGSLVIRRPKERDPNRDLYDHDLPAHVIVLMDWLHTDANQNFPGLEHPDPVNYAIYFIINGRGRFYNPDTGNSTSTPYSVFKVSQGKRYRFRLIGATCLHCPLRFSVQGHNLTIIATDANAVQPTVVDYLIISTGERFDFVINAVNEVKSYWITAVGLGDCEEDNTYQQAILQYEGANESEPAPMTRDDILAKPPGIALNPVNASCGHGENGICISQLEGAENFDSRILKPEPDVNITMMMGYYHPTVKEEFHNSTYHPYFSPGPGELNIFHVNNIYMTTPPSPILSQRNSVDEDLFCPAGPEGIPTCDEPLCHCVNLVKIPLGAVTQFILIDKSDNDDDNHPFHLHGYAFHVMAMGYVKKDESTGKHIANLMKNHNLTQSASPPRKDTLAVPSAGYSVLRIVADNPGYWLFHCHFLRHHVVGMGLLIQVGEPEDNPPVPDGFPKCGDFLPPLKEEL